MVGNTVRRSYVAFPPIFHLLANSLRKKKDHVPQKNTLRAWLNPNPDPNFRLKLKNHIRHTRMNVYYQLISQVEDKGSSDCICKGKNKDDCGKDEVGEHDQTLAKFPKLLRLL